MNARVGFLVFTVLLISTACICSADSAADLERADELQRAGDYQAAIQLYAGVAATAESNSVAATAQLNIGLCYWKQENYQEAMPALKRGIEIAPTGDPVLMTKLNYYLGRCYNATEDYGAAMDLYRQGATEYPDEAANAQLNIGLCYWEQGKYQEAIPALKRGIEIAPTGDPVLRKLNHYLGRCYMATHDYGAFIDLYRQIAVDYPDQAPNAQLNIGVCYWKQGKYQEAIAALKRGIEIAPTGDPVLTSLKCSLGHCYKATDDYGAAIDVYRQVATESQDIAQFYIGLCYWEQGKDQEAVSLLKGVVKDYPDSPVVEEAQWFLVGALQKAGRVDEAVELVKSWLPEVSTLEARAASAEQIAMIYFDSEQYDKAAEAFDHELEFAKLDPSAIPPEREARTRHHLALCYDRMGKRDTAIEQMTEVVERYPQSKWGEYAREMLYVWNEYDSQQD